MRLHKPFLNILRDAKAGTVSDVLFELKLISSGANDIVLTGEAIRALEEIVYTIDFLEQQKLVHSDLQAGDVPRVRISDESARAVSQNEYLNSLLLKNYRKHLIVTPEFTLFAEQGYQMPSVRAKEYNIMLLFVKTIVFAVITAALNRLFL